MVKCPYLVLWWTFLLTSEHNVNSLPTPTATTGVGEGPSGAKSPHPQDIIHPELLQGVAGSQEQKQREKLDRQEEKEKETDENKQQNQVSGSQTNPESSYSGSKQSKAQTNKNTKPKVPTSLQEGLPINKDETVENSSKYRQNPVLAPSNEEDVPKKQVLESSNSKIEESTTEKGSPNGLGSSDSSSRSPSNSALPASKSSNSSPVLKEGNLLDKSKPTLESTNKGKGKSKQKTVSPTEVEQTETSSSSPPNPTLPPSKSPNTAPSPNEGNQLDKPKPTLKSSNKNIEKSTSESISRGTKPSESSNNPPSPLSSLSNKENIGGKPESTLESPSNMIEESKSEIVAPNEVKPSERFSNSPPNPESPPSNDGPESTSSNNDEEGSTSQTLSTNEIEDSESSSGAASNLVTPTEEENTLMNPEMEFESPSLPNDESWESKDVASYNSGEEITPQTVLGNEIKPFYIPQDVDVSLVSHSTDYADKLTHDIFQKLSKDQQLKQLRPEFLSPYIHRNGKTNSQADIAAPEKARYVLAYPLKYPRGVSLVPNNHHFERTQSQQHAGNNLQVQPRGLKYLRYYLQPLSNQHNKLGKIFVLKRVPEHNTNANDIHKKQVAANSEEMENHFGHNDKLVLVKHERNHHNGLERSTAHSPKAYTYRPIEDLSKGPVDKVIHIELNHNGRSRNFVFTSPRVSEDQTSVDVNGHKKPVHVVRIQHNVHGRRHELENGPDVHSEAMSIEDIADQKSMKMLSEKLKLLDSQIPGLNLHELVDFLSERTRE